MKKILPIVGGGILIAAIAMFPHFKTLDIPFSQAEIADGTSSEYVSAEELWEQEIKAKKARREAGYAKADKPSEFAKYHETIRTKWGEKEPAYPTGHRLTELNKLQAAARKSNRRTQVLNWIERGPSNVPGRTRGLLVMPGDPKQNTWLAGSVAGGVWKTTDAGKTWVNKTNNLPNMATTTLVMAAVNPLIIYAGTGESFGGYTGMTGDGIFKSTDGGERWTQLASTARNDDFKNVNRLLIDQQNPQRLLAATSPGYWGGNTSKIMKSVDGGVSWTKVYDAGRNQQNRIVDVEQLVAHPSDFNIQYAAIAGVGVIKSVDAGDTWKAAGPIQADGRIELAIAPTDPSRLFASVVGSVSGSGSDLYASDDGAATWRLVASLSGGESYDYLGGQGWYDNTLAVNPFDKNEVYVAGVNMFRVRTGADGQSTPSFLGVDENNTGSFLSFISFGGSLFNGQLEKGSDVDSKYSNIEIRFGPGIRQKAHRFTVPATSGTNGDGGAGVPADYYEYQDYIEVPFQVWDTDNNRQLMVSFRDQERDGKFNLNDREKSDAQLLDNREYIYINGLTYSTEANIDIAKNGGHTWEHLYFMWPSLTVGGSWDPAKLPQSRLVLKWGGRDVRDGQTKVVCDAYGSFGGPNGFAQTTNATTVVGVHPDHHNLVMVPVDETAKTFKIINASDGGVYVSNVSTEPGIYDGDWKFAGNGYNTTQLYGVDKRPGVDEYFFGSQDNGSWRTAPGETASASSKYKRSLGGDGFEVIWHYGDGNKMMGTIYYNAIYTSKDGGQSWRSATTGLTDSEAGSAPFITKLATHKARPDVVFAVGGQGVWRTVDFGIRWTLSRIASNWTIGSFTDVEVSVANPQVVWAGSGMSPNYKFHVSKDGGKTFVATSNYTAETLGVSTGIYTHPKDDAVAYALFSFAKSPKILKTSDMGKTWQDISGFEGADVSANGFPDVAVYSLLVMPHNPQHIWVGTEIGLVESTDGGKNWMIANNGMPQVAIWDMKVVDDQVVLGTHARGIWSVTIPELPERVYAPVVEQAQVIEAKDLSISLNLSSVYDSTRVFINNTYVTTLAAGGKKLETVLLDAITYENTTIDIKATGYVGKIDYPSTVLRFKVEPLVLGFEDQVKAGQLAFDAYPNPAPAVANLRYNLPKASKVHLRVMDMSGKLIDEVYLGSKGVGTHIFPYTLEPALGNRMLLLELRTDQSTSVFKLLRKQK